jgi:hypothetical protein
MDRNHRKTSAHFERISGKTNFDKLFMDCIWKSEEMNWNKANFRQNRGDFEPIEPLSFQRQVIYARIEWLFWNKHPAWESGPRMRQDLCDLGNDNDCPAFIIDRIGRWRQATGRPMPFTDTQDL